MFELGNVSLGEPLSMYNILKYVDEYSIYSHYLGEELELQTAYSSPLRKDEHPSFSLYRTTDNDRLFFKDSATSSGGDVFEFVQLFLKKEQNRKISFNQVLQNIDMELKLGLYTIPKNGTVNRVKQRVIPKSTVTSEIRITSKNPESSNYWNFWALLDIKKEVLDLYNVTEIQLVHFISKHKKSFYYPKTLGIAYRIADKFKLYYPYASKADKFRNNFPKDWVEGYIQLKYNNPFCIITKAMKEVMFFRQHFDWDSVAGKSENTMIPKHIMFKLLQKYDKIFIWLDSDEAGIEAQNKYIELYSELIPIYYDVPEKDPTDRYAEHLDKQKVLDEIKDLIQPIKDYNLCI